METKILKVVRQGEAFSVQSSKQESGVIQKCNIVLKELGSKFENEYVCTMLGNLAGVQVLRGRHRHRHPPILYTRISGTDVPGNTCH